MRVELFDYMTDGWVALDDVSLTGSTVTKYYTLGGQRVAQRQGSVLTYLHGDHLGSASLATDASGAKITDSDTRYYPYGVTRPGLAGTALPTDRRFTGQREEPSLGFYDYGARPYDPVLRRFLQADTLVPNPANPQSLNRYAYTLNNPLRYTDPSGHYTQDEIMKYLGLDTWEAVEQYFATMPDVLKMLLTSDLTWGSVLVAGNDGQSALRAMFLLLGRAGSDKYRLTLWDLDKGAAVAWDALGQYAQWEVFTDSGNGFARVYDNSPNISKGFSAPQSHSGRHKNPSVKWLYSWTLARSG